MGNTFTDLGLSDELVKGMAKLGFAEPTEIQMQTIPTALTGENLVGQSATGTGKTFAYLLPLIAKIDVQKPQVQAIVLAPTYELAMQISGQLQLILEQSGVLVRSLALIGGANIARQIDKLKKKPQIVVGSAGRILELVKKGKLKLQQTKMLVLDEFDRLLDDQNQVSVAGVQKCLVKDCQYLLFSATAPEKALERAGFLAQPKIIKLTERAVLQATVENLYVLTPFRDKIEALRKLTKILDVKKGLVFVNRVYDLEKALAKFTYSGIRVASLVGSNDKMERKQAIENFRKGKIQLLLATDIAARGLDISGIDYVFNLDIPENEKVYLHRVGRTARAGADGAAISLVDQKEVEKIVAIEKKLRIKFKAKKMVQGELKDFLVRPSHEIVGNGSK